MSVPGQVSPIVLHNINMKIEYKSPTPAEYKRLRELVGWYKVEADLIEKALKTSLFSVIAKEGDIVIGCGRIIGDGGLYFYIQDLIVDPQYQNKGVGKALMRQLITYLKTNARPGAFVGLIAAKGLEKYYEHFGFQVRAADAPGMYQIMRTDTEHLAPLDRE
jgi:predicted N-acetyltransferase YhbS